MASTDYTTAKAPAGFGLVHALASPFVALGAAMVRLAEKSSYMKEVRALQEMSDAELAALGTTREAEVRRIFAGAGAV